MAADKMRTSPSHERLQIPHHAALNAADVGHNRARPKRWEHSLHQGPHLGDGGAQDNQLCTFHRNKEVACCDVHRPERFTFRHAGRPPDKAYYRCRQPTFPERHAQGPAQQANPNQCDLLPTHALSFGFRCVAFKPGLGRRESLSRNMKDYPGQWLWQNNIERARMLLCLAWLVRVEDTPEHREWLNRVAGDLLARQQPSGAIHQTLGRGPGGFFHAPQRNEDYGTSETPLLQQDGDPVSDQLYTTGFALLGPHEAVGPTGDPKLKHAEDKLVEYLCRIQTRSKKSKERR